MNPPLCDCGKTGHTYDGARRVIKQMTWTARRKGKTARRQAVYKCPQHNGWHLTTHSYTITNPKKRNEQPIMELQTIHHESHLPSDTYSGPLPHDFALDEDECPRCIADLAVERALGARHATH